MAGGRVIRICPERSFTFSELGAADTQQILLAERIDCSQYNYVDLIVRVHSGAVGPGTKIEVRIASDGWTSDDPSAGFYKVLTGATVELNSTTAGNPPVLLVGTATSQLGEMLTVVVVGTQHSTTPTTVTARISVDLVLKSCA
jgi:hypothetical protein